MNECILPKEILEFRTLLCSERRQRNIMLSDTRYLQWGQDFHVPCVA